MNVMRAIRFLVGAGVVTVPAFVLAAQQQPAAATAIGECAQAQPRLLQTIDGAHLRLEAARHNNSPAAMRAAMDDLQGALGSLRAQLAACASLRAAAPGDPHAGHAMPGATPAPPPAATGGHAGHAMPAAGDVNVVLTRDPRCTATVTPETAPRADHEGQTYYFCSERDRQLFVADPARYLQGAAPAQTTPAPGETTRPVAATPAPAPARRGASNAPASDPHAAMVMPGAARSQTPGNAAPPAAGGAHAAMTLPGGRTPATDLTQLTCESGVDPRTTPRMLYQGQMYYFCSEQERAVFAKSPAKYVNAPAPEPAPAHAH